MVLSPDLCDIETLGTDTWLQDVGSFPAWLPGMLKKSPSTDVLLKNDTNLRPSLKYKAQKSNNIWSYMRSFKERIGS